MNYQLGRTLQETVTSLAPAEVLEAAKRFFARRQGIYAAFLERESPTHVNLRGQGGEELIIGVAPAPHGTRVTGSTYMFDQQVGRFFATLPPAPEAPSVPEVTGDAIVDGPAPDVAPSAGAVPAAAAAAGTAATPPAGGSPA